jgi:hypothetical protein
MASKETTELIKAAEQLSKRLAPSSDRNRAHLAKIELSLSKLQALADNGRRAPRA